MNIEKRNLLQVVGETYCMILLFLPNEIVEATSIYTITTPQQVRYEYASFFFSFLLIPAIIYACTIRNKTQAIHFDLIIIAILIKDFLYLHFFKYNQEIDYNFSFDFVLLSAWSIVCIIFSNTGNNDSRSPELFFERYFILAFFTQLLRFFLGLSTGGRYGAIGLSVGGTGYLAGLFIVYSLYYRNFNNKMKIYTFLAFISIVLSGQRSNLLFLLLFCGIYVFKICLEKKSTKENTERIFYLVATTELLFLLFVPLLFSNILLFKIEHFEFINRVIEAATSYFNGSIESMDSVEGRFQSFDAGIDIANEFPLGLTNNFYELQYRMLLYNYPTFPHNTLLCCYLLWSPFITLFCILYLIKLFIDLWRIKSGLMWPLLYIILFNTITGSVFIYYPYLVINLFFISLAKRKISKNISEGKLTNEIDKCLVEQA